MNNANDILQEVADYYSAKLTEHGDLPRGVDWNGEGSQVLRFEQLTKIVQQNEVFSINDLGCGYGALLDYLGSNYKKFNYNGCDISGDIIRAAQTRYKNITNAHFYVAAEPIDTSDYGVSSGIFSVRLGRSDAEWKTYID